MESIAWFTGAPPELPPPLPPAFMPLTWWILIESIFSAGFTISRNGQKIGIATDLGIATTMVKQHLKGCDLLILEANHDPEMLMNGPYPWPLKQRIKGRTGHLSNQASGELLSELKHDRLQHVILAHLSETNNTPDKALEEVAPALKGCRARIHVASQDLCGEMLNIE